MGVGGCWLMFDYIRIRKTEDGHDDTQWTLLLLESEN